MNIEEVRKRHEQYKLNYSYCFYVSAISDIGNLLAEVGRLEENREIDAKHRGACHDEIADLKKQELLQLGDIARLMNEKKELREQTEKWEEQE